MSKIWMNQYTQMNGENKMKNNTELKNIYKETKAMNRNLQRITTIGLAVSLSKIVKDGKEKGDEKVVAIGKLGMMALLFVQVLLLLTDIGEMIDLLKERK